MAAYSTLSDVILAVATFRADDSVIELIEEVVDEAGEHPFQQILVVDSLGTGVLSDVATARGWKRFQYENHEQNLGSAGNLHRRLEHGKEMGASWVYAVNHDAEFKLKDVGVLRDVAGRQARIGVAYPLRIRPNRGGGVDDRHSRRMPLPMKSSSSAPKEEYTETGWASSNGTLYSMAPLAEGLQIFPELWMGWEDLAYGWLLEAHGWRQIQVNGSVFRDPYEYKEIRHPFGSFYITDKPPWYTYYQIRNLLLIARRLEEGAGAYAFITLKALQEVVLSSLFRKHKFQRLRLLKDGILDGLNNRSGKGEVP